ncbi:MAG: hypothetical protein LBL74_08235 [Bacteroidales bacterium]|nr:hypothetical protein [Bacteroidales bacterium]
MKKICLLAIGIVFSLSAKAQLNEQYPLLLGQYGLNGTANYISRAGALGAIGGDITAANFNPAGLGIYSKSEITFSSGIYLSSSSTLLDKLKFDNNRAAYNLGNLGMVYTINNESDPFFKSFQFGLALNQLKNFSNNINLARQSNTSYISTIINDIKFTDDLFYQSGVVWIDDTTTGHLTSNFLSGDFDQYKSIETYGSLNSLDLTFATNISNVVYVGAAIGLPYLNYTQSETLTEERFVPDSVTNEYIKTDEYDFRKKTELSGSGVNFKLGIIVKPVDWLRIGAAIHTPTYYEITDSYWASVNNADYVADYYGSASGRADDLLYSIQTPFRFIGSLAFVLGDNTSKVKGSISGDYEYANYSAMKFGSYDNISELQNINYSISDIYRPTHSFRIGGELVTGPFAFRAGFATQGNPYVADINDNSQQYITCGIGFRGQSVSFNLAYAYNLTADSKVYSFYANDDSSIMPASLSQNSHLIQATLGFKF